jgi:CheY-like chemotaxis protein
MARRRPWAVTLQTTPAIIRGGSAIRPISERNQSKPQPFPLVAERSVGILLMTTAQQRVLLVEDDDVGVLLMHALRGEGYLVDLATTTAQAWAHLDANQYALVVVDWKLPDGDGTLIADAAAHLGAKTVVMSGYLFQMPRGRADPHETLMKPVRPSEFVGVVKRSVGKPGTGASLRQPD